MAIKRLVRKFVLVRDNWTCQYCNAKADTHEERFNMTVDHVIPKSRGGTNHELNLVAAFRKCNQEKGTTIYPHANRRMNKAIKEYVRKLEAKVFDHERDKR